MPLTMPKSLPPPPLNRETQLHPKLFISNLIITTTSLQPSPKKRKRKEKLTFP
jgi:hypothetical protein